MAYRALFKGQPPKYSFPDDAGAGTLGQVLESDGAEAVEFQTPAAGPDVQTLSHPTTWQAEGDGSSLSASTNVVFNKIGALKSITLHFTLTIPATGTHHNLVPTTPWTTSPWQSTGYAGPITCQDSTGKAWLARMDLSPPGSALIQLWQQGVVTPQPWVNGETYSFYYQAHAYI